MIFSILSINLFSTFLFNPRSQINNIPDLPLPSNPDVSSIIWLSLEIMLAQSTSITDIVDLYAAVINIEDASPSTSSLWERQMTLDFLAYSDLSEIFADIGLE